MSRYGRRNLDMKKLFSKINMVRTAMALLLTTVVALLLPHADRQSYSYELNQPCATRC